MRAAGARIAGAAAGCGGADPTGGRTPWRRVRMGLGAAYPGWRSFRGRRTGDGRRWDRPGCGKSPGT